MREQRDEQEPREVVKVTSQKVCFLMGDVIGYFFISKKYIRKF